MLDMLIRTTPETPAPNLRGMWILGVTGVLIGAVMLANDAPVGWLLVVAFGLVVLVAAVATGIVLAARVVGDRPPAN